MNVPSIRLVLFICMLSGLLVKAEMKCKLRYDVRNYMNWYNIGSNMVYALYDG